ncbi:MAG TPA: isochorismatase family protein [Myxococcota bacterium]|nr:isochorismatase family protein [Myxococcota bacterium]HRY94396.1 isochorismatase family protein [Myxococcota bacterium]
MSDEQDDPAPPAGGPDEIQSATPAPTRARVAVDWEGLAVAAENQRTDLRHVLELASGQVRPLEAGEECSEAAVLVPPRPPREGWRTMHLFLDQIEDPAVREKLGAALVGRGAFRRFKDLLLAYPELRQQWFAFKDAEVLAYLARWLAREGVAPSNEPPARPDRSRLSAAVRRSAPAPAPAPLPGEALDWRAAVAPWDRPGTVFRPRRAALLVVDMQRAFVDPAGSAFLPAAPAACERLVALVAAWRAAHLPLFFTRHAHLEPRQDGGALSRFWRTLILEGTRDAELVDAFRPQTGERVVLKHTYSAFAGTPLEQALRGLGVEDVVVGGVMTDLCCETTAREAFVRDFNVFFLADGTATATPELQLGSLRSVAHGFGRVLGVDEALGVLAAAWAQGSGGG